MRGNVKGCASAGSALALGAALFCAGCAKTESASPGASSAPAVANTVAVTPSPAGGEASPQASAAAYDDIAGINGEPQIRALQTLGVLDAESGAFDPGKPVERRVFIRWLVKANNALWSDAPAKVVRVADKTSVPAFADVPVSDPDFAYIQGMQDAGYSVGFPDKTFKPDAPLTREQLFAIKNVFDRGSVDSGLAKGIDFARNTIMPPWKDKGAISKTYVAPIATGAGGGAENFALVYGTSALFRPQTEVTRAQAAVAVSVIGDHTFYGSARRTAARAAEALSAATPTAR